MAKQEALSIILRMRKLLQKFLISQSGIIQLVYHTLRKFKVVSWNNTRIELKLEANTSINHARNLPQCSTQNKEISDGSPPGITASYNVLFESLLQYVTPAREMTANSNLERGLTQQKKAIRCFAGHGYRHSCRYAFCQPNFLTLLSLYISETIFHIVITNEPRFGEVHRHHSKCQ